MFRLGNIKSLLFCYANTQTNTRRYMHINVTLLLLRWRLSIKIPPVRPKFTLKVPLNMNIAKQDLLHKKVYEVRSEKDDFMLNY